MTEAEWLACTDPQKMLEFLQTKASDRKLCLFACACCRCLWRQLPDERSRQVVALSEQFVDGAVSEEELRGAIATASEVEKEARKARAQVVAATQAARIAQRMAERARAKQKKRQGQDVVERSDRVAKEATERAKQLAQRVRAELGSRDAILVAHCAAKAAELRDRYYMVHYVHQARLAAEKAGGAIRERPVQVALLRDLFGNPFRSVAINRAWLTWRKGLVVSMVRRMYEDRDFSEMPVLADALEEAGCTDADILDHCRQPGEHVRGCWVVDLILGKS